MVFIVCTVVSVCFVTRSTGSTRTLCHQANENGGNALDLNSVDNSFKFVTYYPRKDG